MTKEEQFRADVRAAGTVTPDLYPTGHALMRFIEGRVEMYEREGRRSPIRLSNHDGYPLKVLVEH